MNSSGDSFYATENCQFRIITDEVIDYICHSGWVNLMLYICNIKYNLKKTQEI